MGGSKDGNSDGASGSAGDGKRSSFDGGNRESATDNHDNLNDSRLGVPSRGGQTESRNQTSESANEGGESGSEGGGESGSENPPDCDPVRDEVIPRPPKRDNSSDKRRDHDYVWPIPENIPPVARINASGGYGTEVRPGGASSVQEPIVGVSGGGSVLPVLIIGP